MHTHLGRRRQDAPALGARRDALDGRAEADWLGWLDIADRQIERVDELERLRDEVREAGFSDALLLGMGGSSLAPEVLAQTFGAQAGSPALHVLDSTDPAQVRAFEQAVDLERTVAIVSSKSGSTLEPNVFRDYFLTRMGELLGAEEAGKRFVAVTDPGSALEAGAQAAGFRHDPARRAVDRRPLLGALGLRHGAGRRRGPAGARDPRARARDGARLRPGRAGRGEPRARARPRARPGARARPRQAHDRRFPGRARPRRLARAADRRVHRQARHRDHPRRPRAAGRAGRPTATTASSPTCAWPTRTTPRRTRPSRRWPRPATRSCAWCCATRPTSAPSSSAGRSRPRWRAPMLGIDPFDQPDVEASQDRRARADGRLRGDRRAARGGAVLGGRGRQALRRAGQRGRARRCATG